MTPQMTNIAKPILKEEMFKDYCQLHAPESKYCFPGVNPGSSVSGDRGVQIQSVDEVFCLCFKSSLFYEGERDLYQYS